MKRLLTTIALLLFVTAAQAGTIADFRPIGFSESGQYYAFAQMGIRDGSGFPFAELWVVDVLKNEQMATSSIELSEEKNGSLGTPEQALEKAIAAAKLDSFSIKPGMVTGTDLLVHLTTDFSSFTNNLFAFDSIIEGGASGAVAKYEALVETTKTEPNAKAGMPGDFGPALMLKLSIVGRDEASGSVQVLQEDKKLPKSRAYPLSYAVRRVTTYKEGLVVIISYTTPGFEGLDLRYMAISGKFQPAKG